MGPCIRHPGPLVDCGYTAKAAPDARKEAREKAVGKYGKRAVDAMLNSIWEKEGPSDWKDLYWKGGETKPKGILVRNATVDERKAFEA